MISVLLITHRRTDLCKRCLTSVLAAIENCPGERFEILVGINGEDLPTQSWLSAFIRGREDLFNVIALSQPVSPGACRNALLPLAAGEWIYFVDDDAYVEIDFFSRFLALPERHRFAAIGGPNLTPPDSDLFQRLSGHALASRLATFLSADRYKSRGELRLCDEQSLISCNLFVRRSELPNTPFPPRLISGEENWMLQNLADRNLSLVYAPDLAVWHERRTGIWAFVRQIFKYGYGRGQIFRRRWRGLRPAHLVPTLCLIYTVAWLSLGTTQPVGWMPYVGYGILCLASGLRGARSSGMPLQAHIFKILLFPVIHVTYGSALLCGLVRG